MIKEKLTIKGGGIENIETTELKNAHLLISSIVKNKLKPNKEDFNMEYQAPELIEIGFFEEMTLGTKYTDTADENSYQN